MNKFLKRAALSILIIIASTLIITAQGKQSTTATTIQVIQFHSEHRCFTCNRIEELTRATLKQYFPTIAFRLVNVDEAKNAQIAEEFEAAGTALFIYNPKTKKKVDLTEFAFMNAKNKPEQFKTGLKNAILKFK